MSLLSILVILIAVGVVVFLVDRAPFIDPEWKVYIRYGVLVVVVLWLLSLFIGAPSLNQIRVGK